MRKDAGPARFTLLDGMTLIVVIAVGLAIVRGFAQVRGVTHKVSISHRFEAKRLRTVSVSRGEFIDRVTANFIQPRSKGDAIYAAGHLAFWSGPFLAGLTLMSARGSLRASRRNRGRPGVVAAGALGLAAVVAALRHPALMASGGVWFWWVEFWASLPRLAGFAVAAAWLGLRLRGRFRVGRGWAPRLGVGVGAAWIGLAVLDLMGAWLFFLG